MHIGIGEYVIILLIIIGTTFYYLPLSAAVITVTSLSSAIIWKLHCLNNYWAKQGIPGPKRNLIFGNLLQLMNGFKTFDIENTKKYGKNFGAVFAGAPTFISSDVDLLREVLVKRFNCFINREIRSITYNENNVGSKMLLVLKDQLWKDVRRTITPAFSSAKMKNMVTLLEECVADLINAFELAINERNGIFEAKELCGKYTMDAIAKCAFGVDVGSQHGNSLFAKYAREILNFTLWDPRVLFITLFPNISRCIENFTGHEITNHKANKYIVDAIRKVIAERRIHRKAGKPDFLQLLLDCSDERCAESEIDREITDEIVAKSGNKVKLNDELIISQCFIFIVAGYETSSATLQFCLYNLATNPIVQENGHEEVMRIVGDKELIEWDDLAKMSYIDHIIKETLRLFPPIPSINRQCNEEVFIDGVKFEKGCNINAAVFAIHYNEEYYPEAERFYPERFSLEKYKTNDPLTFIPFGFGPRNCIGMRFAQLEMRLALAYLLKYYRFITNNKTPKPPLEITTLPFTKPNDPICLTAIRRSI
uniref:Cytochrome P450 3A31 n=1 Tax=Ascaris suum TaxID=6253 RepID=F1L0B8_ASCSU